MKRRLNYLIIVLLIILPFIPIADIIVPKGYVLDDDIFCLILIISSIKIICSTLLIMSHRSYNSNKKGWLLFICGLCMMLPLYLEISTHNPKDYNLVLVSYLRQGYIIIALISLLFVFVKTLLPFKTFIVRSILTVGSLLLAYHIGNNLMTLIHAKSFSETTGSRLETLTISLIYFIPALIGLANVYKGKIKSWKFYAVTLLSLIGVLFCLPNIILGLNTFNSIFINIAMTFIPSYWLGIILLTKSAKKLK